MKYNPDVHRRSSIRLKDYDYSKEGMYFITICTKNRECILSEITNVGVGVPDDPKLQLTDIGCIVEKHINNINKTYKNVAIYEYIIMPNHVHMIINIDENINRHIRVVGDADPYSTKCNIAIYYIYIKKIYK